MVAVTTPESIYLLKFDRQRFQQHLENNTAQTEEGFEDAFELLQEVDEVVTTGCWVGDCFVFSNIANRLNYLVGDQTSTIHHFNHPIYVLGYYAKTSRVYVCDRNMSVMSYSLPMNLIAYQTCILHGEREKAAALLPEIPSGQLNRLARFLESQGLKNEALEITNDPEHRFDLAMALEKLNLAFKIAADFDDENKWIQLGDLALSLWDYGTALESFKNAKDLESCFLIYQCSGNAQGLQELAVQAIKENKINIALLCFWLLGQTENCIDLLVATNRITEAALLARSYLPSQIDTVLSKWKESLGKAGKAKFANTLADSSYSDCFPDHQISLQIQGFLHNTDLPPAAEYATIKELDNYDFINELKDGKSLESMLISYPKNTAHSRDPLVGRSRNASPAPATFESDYSRSPSPTKSNPLNESRNSSPKVPYKDVSAPLVLNPRHIVGHEEIKDSLTIADNMSYRSLEVNTTGTNSLRAQSEGFNEDGPTQVNFHSY